MGPRSLAVALVALTITPDVPPADCRSAAASYAAALAAVTEALRTYEACLTASRGRNQCSAEFDELGAVQLDYEDAVVAILPSVSAGAARAPLIRLTVAGPTRDPQNHGMGTRHRRNRYRLDLCREAAGGAA